MNRTSRNLARSARAFSMLELTFVLVVISILLLVVGINFPRFVERARVRTTKASMTSIKTAIQSYQAETAAYPPSLQALVPEYLPADMPLKDSWKRDFYYESATVGGDVLHPYVLRSMGGDGLSGTADDIDVWTMNQQ